MDWSELYPAFRPEAETEGSKTISAAVEVADIGCGFGGLLFALSPVMPETLILGKKLRPWYSAYGLYLGLC